MKTQLLLAALLLSVVPAFAQVPKPPAKLCIDNKCPETPDEPTAGAKKWHPGHYLKTQGNAYATDQNRYIDGVMNVMPKVLELPQLKGAYVDIAWGAINPTGSTYNWTDLDNIVNWLCSRDKNLILSVSYKSFGGADTPQLIMPADLVAKKQYDRTNMGMISAIWRPEVMNRFISAMNAVADRYDSSPCLEMVTTSESAPSFGGVDSPGDYSVGALAEQLMRLYAAQAKAFNKTTVAAQINFLGDQAASLVEEAYDLNAGRAGPDSIDDAGTLIFNGQQVTGAGHTARDYRGLLPHHVVASAPALGGKSDNGPPANIIKWAQQSGITHLSWVATVTESGNTWSDIKRAIQDNPGLATACPKRYAGCVTN
jgi:hypothetical protein